MKMKKEYISPSIQVLQIESESILSGSNPQADPFNGMNDLPSDPGFYDYDEEY